MANVLRNIISFILEFWFTEKNFPCCHIFLGKLMPRKMVFACLVDYEKVAHSKVAYVWLSIYLSEKVIYNTCYALNKGKELNIFYLKA